MMGHDPDPAPEMPRNDGCPDPRSGFEEFTSGGAWRSLPLKIKLTLVHLWRSEHDVPVKPSDE